MGRVAVNVNIDLMDPLSIEFGRFWTSWGSNGVRPCDGACGTNGMEKQPRTLSPVIGPREDLRGSIAPPWNKADEGD